MIAPVFNPHAGYDGIRDFTHIGYLGGPPAAMLVHPSLGATTYKDFLALARSAKAPISCISAGTGSHGFLVAEYVAQRENYKINHIPYKGAGPALTDLVAGHDQIDVAGRAHGIRRGRDRALGAARAGAARAGAARAVACRR